MFFTKAQAIVLKNPNTSAGQGFGRDAKGDLYYGHNLESLDPVVVYRSTNDARTWSEYDAGIPPYLEGRRFAVDPVDRKLYAVIMDEKTGRGWLYCTVNNVQ